MSNRFVSGGTISSSGEISKDVASSHSAPQPPKNEEWEAVQQELEAERKRREEARVKAAAGEERSLYDVLQANKAAKQAAFEEQSKVRNQFRALDDDEIEFLDEVRAKKRDEERKAKQEVEEGLKAFREARKGDNPTTNTEEAGEGEEWAVSRKRKRAKEREMKGVKRKASEQDEKEKLDELEKGTDQAQEVKDVDKKQTAQQPAAPIEKKSLGLVGYGSDSDDDDD